MFPILYKSLYKNAKTIRSISSIFMNRDQFYVTNICSKFQIEASLHTNACREFKHFRFLRGNNYLPLELKRFYAKKKDSKRAVKVLLWLITYLPQKTFKLFSSKIKI